MLEESVRGDHLKQGPQIQKGMSLESADHRLVKNNELPLGKVARDLTPWSKTLEFRP